MHERVTPDQDLAISQILHSSSKVLYEPGSKPTIHTFQANFDPDNSFSAEELKFVDSISCLKKLCKNTDNSKFCKIKINLLLIL